MLDAFSIRAATAADCGLILQFFKAISMQGWTIYRLDEARIAALTALNLPQNS